MTAQHTPGPWFRDDCAESVHMAQCIIENPLWIAIEDTSDDGGHLAYCHPENADLIAAAPAMLAALELAESFMAGFEGDELQDDMDDHLATIRAAIALAYGAPTDGPAHPIAGEGGES